MPIGFPKKRPKSKAGGRWVFVEDENLTPKQKQDNLEAEMDEVTSLLATFSDPRNPFAAVEQFVDYFPGNQEIPEDGGWILMTKLLPTEFTPPPFSLWFAEPWPMDSGRHTVHRVKIITPRGELGVFPHEYSRVLDPGKYWEFIGTDMKVCFFGGNEEGIPKDKLFYLRSRGISKRDAITMLVGEIKAHGVLWLETAPHITEQFGMKWPDPSRLATVVLNENPRPANTPVSATSAPSAGGKKNSGQTTGENITTPVRARGTAALRT